MVRKAAQAAFDLATALTRKETRTIRKNESMVQYHLARMPMYGAHESDQYKMANYLRDANVRIESKARERWDNGHM